MKIEPGEKVYERTADRNVFLEWRLVSVTLLMSELVEKKGFLTERMALNPKPVETPDHATEDQVKAIAYYNSSMVGPMEILRARLDQVNALIETLERLPDGR